MEVLAQFHPQLVHTPIALIIFSALFMIVGRLADVGWWRKAAIAMLLVGFVGGWVALKSGEGAGDHAEDQGVPERAVDAHEDMARITLWLAGGALVLLGAAARVRPAAGALNTLALLLQIGAAVAVGVTGHRGGILVYEHGANVKTGGAARDSAGVVRPAGETGEAETRDEDGAKHSP